MQKFNYKYNIKVLMIIFICAGSLLFTFILVRSHHSIRLQGYSETYQQFICNKKLARFKNNLPYSAKKIFFRIYPYMQAIDLRFEVIEEDFINWMKINKWTSDNIILPISIDTILMNNGNIQDTTLEIHKGYFYKKNIDNKESSEMLKSSLQIYFDKETNQCYVSYILN